MQITFPPVLLVRSHKLFRTLHISQQHHFVCLAVNLIKPTMTPFVRIGVYQEPLIVNEMLMTI